MMYILLLHSHRTAKQRVHGAARLSRKTVRPHTVVECEAWSVLWMQIRSHHPAVAIVEPPHEALGHTEFRKLFQHRDLVPVLPYLTRESMDITAIQDWILRGVGGILWLGQGDDPTSILRVILKAVDQVFVDKILRHLNPHLHAADARDYLRAALRVPPEYASPRRLAREAGVDRRSLERRLKECGLASPRELGELCRLLRAASLLENPTVAVESIALDLGYPDARSLRRSMKLRAGVTPSALRLAGGPRALIENEQFRYALRGGSRRQAPRE